MREGVVPRALGGRDEMKTRERLRNDKDIFVNVWQRAINCSVTVLCNIELYLTKIIRDKSTTCRTNRWSISMAS